MKKLLEKFAAEKKSAKEENETSALDSDNLRVKN